MLDDFIRLRKLELHPPTADREHDRALSIAQPLSDVICLTLNPPQQITDRKEGTAFTFTGVRFLLASTPTMPRTQHTQSRNGSKDDKETLFLPLVDSTGVRTRAR